MCHWKDVVNHIKHACRVTTTIGRGQNSSGARAPNFEWGLGRHTPTNIWSNILHSTKAYSNTIIKALDCHWLKADPLTNNINIKHIYPLVIVYY